MGASVAIKAYDAACEALEWQFILNYDTALGGSQVDRIDL